MPSVSACVLTERHYQQPHKQLIPQTGQRASAVLVIAAGKECVERRNKSGETWKVSLAKRDKHTHDTQVITAAPQPVGKAVISRSFCHTRNT